MRVYDNGNIFTHRETTTTLKVEKGWNYIAIHCDEIYEYSYFTMYHRNELHVSPTVYSKYESYIKGYYYTAASGTADEVVVFGCKMSNSWGTTASWPNTFNPVSYAASTWPTDVLYGLCMKGWINSIDIWGAGGNWDSIFNADIETKT